MPLIVFLVGWLEMPAALFCVGLLALSLTPVLRGRQRGIRDPIPARVWLVLGLVAALWVGASGLAGGLRLNDDWQVRLSVLRDLSVGAWPVSYGQQDGGDLLLRFPMAYYLVPALLGRVAGPGAVQLALSFWTVAGVLLFLGLVLSALPGRTWRTVALVVLVVVGFSGMDIVGWALRQNRLPATGEHLEWWHWMFQYSSNMTLLFWAPNHCLPAWLAATLVWRHRDTGLALAPAALLLVAVAAWAPLVAAGLLPLLALCTVRGQTASGWLREAAHPGVLAAVPILLLLASFVTFGVPAKESGMALAQARLQAGLLPYLVESLLAFSFVEWGLLALVLWRAERMPSIFWAAAVLLLVLPVLRFGPGNDIVMRGGIVALTLLMMTALQQLDALGTPRLARAAIAAVLLLGCATPWQEFRRALLPGSAWQDDGRTLVMRHDQPWHYVGVLGDSWLRRVLREPQQLGPGVPGR